VQLHAASFFFPFIDPTGPRYAFQARVVGCSARR
jgi:hypothetical protein